MSTTTAPVTVSDNVLSVEREIRVNAPIAATFDALLEQLGPGSETPDGKPMNLKVEAFPGGRWYRDLGDGNGHCWGHVQAIKRPTLLEFSGPLMMSLAVSNNVQYRLKEEGGATVISFHHYGFGVIPEGFRTGMPEGWRMIIEAVKARAEKAVKK